MKNKENDEIDLAELFGYLLSRALPILLVAVLFGVLAFCFSAFYIEPEYEAESGVFIVSSGNSLISYTDLQLSSSLTQDYAEIAKTRTVAEKVIEATGVELTYEELGELLTVTNPSDTKILYFTIRYTDPEIAARLANAYAEILQTEIVEIMNIEKPTIFQKAVVNDKKVAPSNAKYAVMGFLAGFILMCGIFIVRHLMDETVTSIPDVENLFGMKTLAAIPADADELRELRQAGHRRKKSSGRQGR